MSITQAVDSAIKHRRRLDELDRLRIITALSVVGVHVLGNTTFLDHTAIALETQDAFVTALHFTREVFMFVTALALVYVYYGKPFAAGRFFQKRAIAVLIPYALWTLIYALINTPSNSLWHFSQTLLLDLLTGSASYQLYYILLTLEFYLIFPWFLRALPAMARRPWLTVGVSFALEVAILVADQHLVPTLPLSAGAIASLGLFLNRFAPVYQLYFVLGALVAVYLKPIQAFIARHGAWMAAAGVGALVALEAHYVFSVNVRHDSVGGVIIVLQPIMVVYSVGCIAFLYWMTRSQALRVTRRDDERTRRMWRELSDAAFGVYLIHPLILSALLAHVAPHLAGWPVALEVALLWLLTAAGATAGALLLLHLPVISRAVGRASPIPVWLSAAWANITWALWGMSRRSASAQRDPGDYATLPALERVAAQESLSDDTPSAAER